jgi:putative ABC transport system permease protein
MAMSVRERTREVAVLKTLGFTKGSILGLFVGEAISLSLAGGILGIGIAFLLVSGAASQGGFLTGMKVTPGTMLFALMVAALVGFLSAFIPSYQASRTNIVDGLRHIG